VEAFRIPMQSDGGSGRSAFSAVSTRSEPNVPDAQVEKLFVAKDLGQLDDSLESGATVG